MEFIQPIAQSFQAPSLEPVIERLHDFFSLGWRAHKREIAGCLQELRNGHRALRALIHEHTEADREPRLRGAQSFLLEYNDAFAIRINLWPAKSFLAEVNPRYRRYLSIDEMHNHDFDFFTISLSGPGYESRFFKDRDFNPDLTRGDKLDLEPLGMVALSGSQVLFVNRFTDYHSQQWPVSFTTTLNLIPRENPAMRVQYVVDETNHLVRDVIRGSIDV
ncbi:MAG TPA: hypothetical protein VGB04_02090 [Allosphingosinicella sp.]|jgi:hypothetical protein